MSPAPSLLPFDALFVAPPSDAALTSALPTADGPASAHGFGEVLAALTPAGATPAAGPATGSPLAGASASTPSSLLLAPAAPAPAPALTPTPAPEGTPSVTPSVTPSPQAPSSPTSVAEPTVPAPKAKATATPPDGVPAKPVSPRIPPANGVRRREGMADMPVVDPETGRAVPPGQGLLASRAATDATELVPADRPGKGDAADADDSAEGSDGPIPREAADGPRDLVPTVVVPAHVLPTPHLPGAGLGASMVPASGSVPVPTELPEADLVASPAAEASPAVERSGRASSRPAAAMPSETTFPQFRRSAPPVAQPESSPSAIPSPASGAPGGRTAEIGQPRLPAPAGRSEGEDATMALSDRPDGVRPDEAGVAPRAMESRPPVPVELPVKEPRSPRPVEAGLSGIAGAAATATPDEPAAWRPTPRLTSPLPTAEGGIPTVPVRASRSQPRAASGVAAAFTPAGPIATPSPLSVPVPEPRGAWPNVTGAGFSGASDAAEPWLTPSPAGPLPTKPATGRPVPDASPVTTSAPSPTPGIPSSETTPVAAPAAAVPVVRDVPAAPPAWAPAVGLRGEWTERPNRGHASAENSADPSAATRRVGPAIFAEGRREVNSDALLSPNQQVKKSSVRVGTENAKLTSPMSSPFSSFRATVPEGVGASPTVGATVSTPAPAFPATPTGAAEAGRETTAASALQAVREVLDVAERLAAAPRSSGSVQVRLDDVGVSVRVECRDGEVRATFVTDSSDLRDHLAAAWQVHATSGENRNFRLADPVFTTASGASASASFSGQGQTSGGDAGRQFAPPSPHAPSFAGGGASSRGSAAETTSAATAGEGLPASSNRLLAFA